MGLTAMDRKKILKNMELRVDDIGVDMLYIPLSLIGDKIQILEFVRESV